MIRISNKPAKAMEFAVFKKKDNITDDELINTVLTFEKNFLSRQKGIIFHCLVRNFENEYANLMFVENESILKKIQEKAFQDNSAMAFFQTMQENSIQMNIHHIHKENFEVPTHFSCIEHGTFSLKPNTNFEQLLLASMILEEKYLNTFENSKAHFIGSLKDNLYSEIALGNTLGQTKQICFGYLENEYGLKLLDLLDSSTMKLNFSYVVA